MPDLSQLSGGPRGHIAKSTMVSDLLSLVGFLHEPTPADSNTDDGIGAAAAELEPRPMAAAARGPLPLTAKPEAGNFELVDLDEPAARAILEAPGPAAAGSAPS